ncbi:hypothetical protein CG716_24915 [Mycolicibacterium sphagni]|uniref:Uncharacterized protein n=1 Tax=Mycolicibacterium sphagni TaxID=1786 RepID=A0A255DAI7_9MYCO|nr:hypothetical protein CG716_24915 [Mycolicibacterium sphagni]
MGIAPAKARTREADYVSRAAEKLNSERDRRLVALRDARTKMAIARATDRLASIAHPDRGYVLIRSPFIYRADSRGPRDSDRPENIATRPPLTQILKGKNPYAIALYLTYLFVHQMIAAHAAGNNPDPPEEPRRRHSVYNIGGEQSWASLIGLPSTDRRNQRKTYNRALDALHKWELVDLGAAQQRYANFTLNREDGSGRPYKAPSGVPTIPQHLCIPAEFFTAGWHLILTPSELATFLGVCHVSDRKQRRRTEDEPPGSIFLAESVRYQHLGLSDEAYLSIHQLAEFGLIKTDDPMPGRRRGRVPPTTLKNGRRHQPYQLTATVLRGYPSTEMIFDLDTFKRPAIEVASDRFSRPLPRYANTPERAYKSP